MHPLKTEEQTEEDDDEERRIEMLITLLHILFYLGPFPKGHEISSLWLNPWRLFHQANICSDPFWTMGLQTLPFWRCREKIHRLIPLCCAVCYALNYPRKLSQNLMLMLWNQEVILIFSLTNGKLKKVSVFLKALMFFWELESRSRTAL